uniref:Uncharacterized protein n=1 Tax=Arundo donax TaxID=35708 RepID=A0A0A9DE93_ARUDO
MLPQYLICSHHKCIDRVYRYKHHSSPDSHLPNDQYNRQCNQCQEKEPNIPHEAPSINLHILLRHAQRHCPDHNTSHKYSSAQHAVEPHITGTTPHKRCNARKHIRSTITKGEQRHTGHCRRKPQQRRHLLKAAAEVIGGRVTQHVEQRRQAQAEHSIAQQPEPLALTVEETQVVHEPARAAPRVGSEELALRREPLVPCDAGARDGRILHLLAVQRSDHRKVRTSRCGASRIRAGEESTVHRERTGAQKPRSTHQASIGAAVQEEEEQHQGCGGEGPDPARRPRLRRDHLRRGHGRGIPRTRMPNSGMDLKDLAGRVAFSGGRG